MAQFLSSPLRRENLLPLSQRAPATGDGGGGQCLCHRAVGGAVADPTLNPRKGCLHGPQTLMGFTRLQGPAADCREPCQTWAEYTDPRPGTGRIWAWRGSRHEAGEGWDEDKAPLPVLSPQSWV